MKTRTPRFAEMYIAGVMIAIFESKLKIPIGTPPTLERLKQLEAVHPLENSRSFSENS